MNSASLSIREPLILTEYLQWIQNCYNGCQAQYRPLFFRGHADKEWLLQPAVFRNSKLKERGIILDYKQAFVEEVDYVSSMERILIEMQHHQIPTRLLDWSISPLIALYFACSSEEYQNRNAMVYALNPWHVYNSIKEYTKTPTYYMEIMRQARLRAALNWTVEEITEYIRRKFNYGISSRELELPLPIVGRNMDERVRTQQGCFTLWGIDRQALDFFSPYKSNLNSFEISAKDKPSLLKFLSQLGINEFALFTDKEGMSKSICRNGSIFYIN